MSALDDTRKLLQDMIAPDLKAIGTRLDTLEKHVEQRFDAAEKSVNHRFDAIEQIATLRHELILVKMDNIVSLINAHQDSVSRAMNFDRRMEQLESRFDSQSPAQPRIEERLKSA